MRHYEPEILPGKVFGVPVNLAAEGVTYEIQWSDDLKTWEPNNDNRLIPIGEKLLGGSHSLRLFRDTNPGNAIYLRVRAGL